MEKEQIKILWDNMKLQLNEMQRRQYAATLAKAYGYGGATVVNELRRALPASIQDSVFRIQNDLRYYECMLPAAC